MKRLIASAAFLLLNACQSYPEPVDVRYLDDTNLEGTVSVLKSSPKPNAIDVPSDAEVIIDFSGAIKRDSVDSFRFQVVDEFGIPLKGRTYYEKDGTRLRFVPTRGGKRTSFSRATTYRVHARYLEDRSGYLIGSNSFKFRTADKIPSTGRFQIKKIYPQENLSLPGQKIAVQFTEEVAPDPSSPDGCSTSMWLDAFQVLKVPLLAEETGLLPVNGKVCRVYNEDTRKHDMLIFEPAEHESILQGGDYFDIVIRPTPSLYSAESQEHLPEGSAETVRTWVIPIDMMFEFLF